MTQARPPAGGDEQRPAGEPASSWPQAPGSPAGYGQPGSGQPPPPGYGSYGQPAPPPGYGSYGQPGPPPGYGSYGQPGPPTGYGLPAYPQPSYGGPGGWNVAPAPGGIPLRPLSMGEILNGAVNSARRNPAATFGLAAIVMAVNGVITAILDHIDTSQASTTTFNDQGHLVTPGGASLATTAGVWVLALVVTSVLTGMLSGVVGRGVLGRKISIAEAWRGGRAGPVAGAAFLLLLIAVCVPIPVVLVVVGLAVAHVGVGAVLVGVFGGIAALVTEILLYIRLILTLPTLVLERTAVAQAIRRSWVLTKGSFWRLFGILLLTTIIVLLAGLVLELPFEVIAVVLAGGSLFKLAASASVAAIIVNTIGSIVAATVTRPISAAVTVLLYVDLRIRREGLDLTLRDAATGEALTGDEFAAAWRPPTGVQGPSAAW